MVGQPLKQHASYEDDFHAWADDQARLLRSRSAHRADLENIAEELEGLSRSERRALQSSLRLIVLHMLKMIHQPERATQSWRNTIFRERLNVEEALADMPSLNHRLPEIFAKAYAEGRKLAIQETGKSPDLFAAAPELTLQQVRDDSFLPSSVTWELGSIGPEAQAASAGSLVILPRADEED